MRTIALGSSLLTLFCLGALASASEAEPELFYQARTPNGFELRLRDVATSHERVLTTGDKEMEPLFWDVHGPGLIYVASGKLLRIEYDRPDAEGQILAPVPDQVGAETDCWMDGTNARLRCLLRQLVEGDAIAIVNGRERWRLQDGAEIDGVKPEWGTRLACSVVERAAVGWKVVARAASWGEAEGAPDCSVVGKLRSERGAMQRALLLTGSCVDGCGESAPPDLVSRLQPSPLLDRQIDEVRAIRDPSGGALVFGASFGDTLHAMAPVWFVKAPGEPTRLPPLLGEYDYRQIAIWKSGGFALITEEYSGGNPHVVELATGDVVFSGEGDHAVWAPAHATTPDSAPARSVRPSSPSP